MVETLLFLAGMCFGISFTTFVTIAIKKRANVGTLRIDRSDPNEAPYLFLELSKPIHYFKNRDYVNLNVRDENYISQK